MSREGGIGIELLIISFNYQILDAVVPTITTRLIAFVC